MKNLGVNEIREQFLQFFESKDHVRLQSFPLVPHNDNSLLLINSGMAPMKAFFTGQETPPSKRVATCQKCIRTGDIENVGKTARHGTFFEMLGDFSFGDYFKNEIIPWSWEFVTEVLGVPQDRLYVTIFEDDDESGDVWHEKVGVPRERIKKLGREDNFWQHGLGPCGPCTEIYYDRGEAYGCGSPTCGVGCDCDRYMEFWNLVLTQFNAEEDGSYTELAQKNVDTGMGLERMATILQGVDSIFDVDTVRSIRDVVCQKAGIAYGNGGKTDVSVRVITDHVRSVTMMTADGVLPSNEGRGYVLRRLLRRAARHGKLLGIKGEFLAELSRAVIACSGDAYPELVDKQEYIYKILSVEENSFYKTIDNGMEILRVDMDEMKAAGQTLMSGEKSFRLYDTYGFPIDLTKEILEEAGMQVDEAAFAAEMKAQKERARAARGESSYMGAEATVYHELPVSLETVYAGYDVGVVSEAKVAALIAGNTVADAASAGDTVSVFLDNTPFYAESGGQIGDCGSIQTETGLVRISDCIKVVGGKIAHVGEVVEGSISVGQRAVASIDADYRLATARNHSTTHLLQKALRAVLGSHVEQAGSYVSAERLRFDFTHFTAMTDEEIQQTEKMVNDAIFTSYPIVAEEMSIDTARQKGAVALFGEKYGDVVRVVDMGGFSIELCGGAHLENTAQAGSFKIVSESGVAAGVRRIEALTGMEALKYYRAQEMQIKELCRVIKSSPDKLMNRLEQLVFEQKELTKELESLKAKMAGGTADELLAKAEEIKGVKILVAEVQDMDANAMRVLGDQLKNKMGSGVVILAGALEGKVSLLAMATDDAVAKGVHAGNIIKQAAAACGGGGGGRPNMAQAGGKEASKIADALQIAKEVVDGQL